MPNIRALFVDVGGVLATNGWDTDTRQAAAAQFQLDLKDMDSRHRMTFDTYEIGKLSLDDYLSRVVFYQPRSFSRKEFIDFIFAQSKPFPEMLELISTVKRLNGLKVAVVSNEGRELTEYRIKTFGLAKFVDCFVSSCFVHFRKPDLDIWRMALDLLQAVPDEVAYIDDRQMFVEVGSSLGIHGIRHQTVEGTRDALRGLGLKVE